MHDPPKPIRTSTVYLVIILALALLTLHHCGYWFSLRDMPPSDNETGETIHIKESSPRDEFEIRGSVVKLERPEGADIGKATIHGLIDDQPRKVVVELRDADYHEAVTAHDQARFVRCSGVLVREGRGFRLLEPYDFTIEKDDF